jgi:hypothetical protein
MSTRESCSPSRVEMVAPAEVGRIEGREIGNSVEEPEKSVTLTLKEPEAEGAESETVAVRASSVAAGVEEEGAEWANSRVCWKALGLAPTRKPPSDGEVQGEGAELAAAAFAASSSRRATKMPA